MATERRAANGARGEPQLFLLRVWLEDGGFRAALRRVGPGEPSVFTQPAALGEFLDRTLRPPAAGDPDHTEGGER